MASTKQMQERAKARVKAIKAIGNGCGFDTKRLKVFGDSPMFFMNINTEYDKFVKALREIGFDWTFYLTHGGRVNFSVVLSQTKIHNACAGEFGASEVCDNGEPLCEFAVGASYFTIIEQAMAQVQRDLGTKMCIPMMTLLPNGDLNVIVMRP